MERQASIPNLKNVIAERTWKISKCKIIQSVCLNELKFIYKMKLVGKSDWIFTFFMYFLDYSDYFPVIANIDDNLATSFKQKLNGETEEWYLKTKHTIRVNDQIEIGLVSELLQFMVSPFNIL